MMQRTIWKRSNEKPEMKHLFSVLEIPTISILGQALNGTRKQEKVRVKMNDSFFLECGFSVSM